ncbi:Argininosuccinate synthase [Candidatus Gugararchaeum adminiculabundum]|nr:Argininosuccinate synthase [Candidatus Gugararchaeum adminiculabundum]
MKNSLVQKVKEAASGEYDGIKKCAVAFSGGLEAVVISSFLADEFKKDVLLVILDLGQSQQTIEKAKGRAKELGLKCIVVDNKNSFASNIARGVKANTFSEGHLNAEGLSRPVIASTLVEVARENRCDCLVHGSTGYGNDQLRMDLAFRVLAPDLHSIAPVRDWDLKRDEEIDYAKSKGLSVDATQEKPYSFDENLWGRIIRCGIIDEQDQEIPEETYKWTVNPVSAPNSPERVIIGFDNGVPVSAFVKGKSQGKESESAKGVAEVVALLNKVGGKHGVGRFHSIEDKVVGLKQAEAYEAPAALILNIAHKDLEKITLTSKQLDVKDYIDHLWTRVVYDGLWFSRLREDLEGFIDSTQKSVDGSVEVELYKGSASVVSRKSRHALYDAYLGRRDSKGAWNQQDARIFAKLYGFQESIAFAVGRDSE